MDFSFGFLFGTKTTIRLSQFCVGLLTEVILKGKKVIVHYERYQKNMTHDEYAITNGNRVLGLTAIDHGQSSVLFRIPFKNLPSSLKKFKLSYSASQAIKWPKASTSSPRGLLNCPLPDFHRQYHKESLRRC